jgi:hypothetical protein
VKLCYFALIPHRDLPDDFERRCHSVWADVPWGELGDARRFGDYYNWTLDEHLAAARTGADGLCSNEHHQNAYGCLPNPSLICAILARATGGTQVGIVQIGSTLPSSVGASVVHRVEIVAGAGHELQLERPDVVTSMVLGFLGS